MSSPTARARRRNRWNLFTSTYLSFLGAGCPAPRRGSDDPVFLRGPNRAADPYYQEVEANDTDNLPRRQHAFGNLQVVGAGGRITAGVIMRDDDRRASPQRKCRPVYLRGTDRALRDGSRANRPRPDGRVAPVKGNRHHFLPPEVRDTRYRGMRRRASRPVYSRALRGRGAQGEGLDARPDRGRDCGPYRLRGADAAVSPPCPCSHGALLAGACPAVGAGDRLPGPPLGSTLQGVCGLVHPVGQVVDPVGQVVDRLPEVGGGLLQVVDPVRKV